MSARLKDRSPAGGQAHVGGGGNAIRVLLVFLAIALFVAVTPMEWSSHLAQAQHNAAVRQLAQSRDAIVTFHADTGRYPTATEGLGVLTASTLSRPGGPDHFPVLDPWGHAYLYRSAPSANLAFEVRSAGPDGQIDTGDDLICPTSAASSTGE